MDTRDDPVEQIQTNEQGPGYESDTASNAQQCISPRD